jgi:hypothetical protein
MSSENVVSLRNGQPLSSAAQPNATVIEELERLLEAARAGEITGIAGSYTHKDKQITYSYAGSVISYAMIGGLDCLKERIVRIALSKD